MEKKAVMIYLTFAIIIYAMVATVLVLAVIFGRRARRNVKNERVTKMPNGFSPLDVQRIFIGKTYPRRLTAALITHWAQMGHACAVGVVITLVILLLGGLQLKLMGKGVDYE